MFSNSTLAEYILRGCAKYHFKKFVFPSSGLIYKPRCGVPLCEDDDLIASSVYTTAKIETEKAITGLSSGLDVQSFIVRLSNVYGPQSSKDTFFGALFYQVMASNDKISLLRLRSRIDFIYINDVSRALQCIVESSVENKLNIYNVSLSQSHSLLEISRKVCREVGMPQASIESISHEKDEINRILSNKKILKELGWSPEYTIDAGIKDSISCLRSRV